MRIFLDTADLAEMENAEVDGYTTNPSLIRKAGHTDYLAFAKEAANLGKPVSLEVIADNPADMYRQALVLAELGENVYVKIPITTTTGQTTLPVVATLGADGVKVNVTAVMTATQAREAFKAEPAIVSVFAGRIADTGRAPMDAWPLIRSGDLLWASTREAYNVVQAEEAGFDIITVSPELLAKVRNFGQDLDELSLATVRQFHDDATEAGYEF